MNPILFDLELVGVKCVDGIPHFGKLGRAVLGHLDADRRLFQVPAAEVKDTGSATEYGVLLDGSRTSIRLVSPVSPLGRQWVFFRYFPLCFT